MITELTKTKAGRVMGIDANTHSLAFCIFYNRRPVQWGKINFEGGDFYLRLRDAGRKLRAISEDFDVDFIVLEGAILAATKNADVTIKLSMMYGCILSELMRTHTQVITCKPSEWQNYIGNKNLSTVEKAALKVTHPGKSIAWYRDKGREIRKQRTMDFFNAKWPHVKLEDDDVGDSFGLAYWAYYTKTRR